MRRSVVGGLRLKGSWFFCCCDGRVRGFVGAADLVCTSDNASEFWWGVFTPALRIAFVAKPLG